MSRVVRAYPAPKAYFEVAPDQVYVNDVSIRCFNLSQGATSFLWDFGDGDTSRSRSRIINIWKKAYMTSACGHIRKTDVLISISFHRQSRYFRGDVRFPTVFMPNKTGPIERTDLPTGGTEVDQFFYPPYVRSDKI